MGFIGDLLGFNKESIWKKVAEEVDGQFIDKGFFLVKKLKLILVNGALLLMLKSIATTIQQHTIQDSERLSAQKMVLDLLFITLQFLVF